MQQQPMPMMQQGVPQGGQPVMMMQGQPGMVQQMPMQQMGGGMQVGVIGGQDPRVLKMASTPSGFAKLDMVTGIFVKQKIDLFEALSGCELPNKYVVSELNPAKAGLTKEGDSKAYYSNAMGLNMFKAKELSGCLERQFCRGAQRPLDIQLNHEAPNDYWKTAMGTNHGQPFLRMEKPCKPIITPCACRPEMIVRHCGVTQQGGQPENRRIGRIVLPCQFMSPKLDVYWNSTGTIDPNDDGSNEDLIYTITADCCQCGLWMPECWCEMCQTVTFEITQPGSDQSIGILEKRTKGCAAAMFTDADNFLVTFPAQASNAESKALLMSAILFCDFMMFEDTKQQKNQGQGGMRFG